MPFAPFTISGCRFLFRDGSKHHGVGIQPDIFCSSTDALINIDSKLEEITRIIKK
jgi:hypothetical protein